MKWSGRCRRLSRAQGEALAIRSGNYTSTAGAAIALLGQELTIDSSTFTENTADSYGGVNGRRRGIGDQMCGFAIQHGYIS